MPVRSRRGCLLRPLRDGMPLRGLESLDPGDRAAAARGLDVGACRDGYEVLLVVAGVEVADDDVAGVGGAVGPALQIALLALWHGDLDIRFPGALQFGGRGG